MTTRPARPAMAGLLILSAVLLASCSPVVDHRGYLPRQGDMQNLQQGMSKVEVEALLGSPSTTATINFTGDSYYYISSVVEERAFLRPKEVERQVVAIRFSQAEQVESFAHYGLEDGRIINFSNRETPTRGRELSILQQLISNAGNVSPLPQQ